MASGRGGDCRAGGLPAWARRLPILLLSVCLRAQEGTIELSAPLIQAQGQVVKVFAALAPESPRRQVGSGVLVAPGLVATNAHVVLGGTWIGLEQRGRGWTARLCALDLSRDLALLEVPDLPLPPARFAEAPPAGGERVYSWSYPGGEGPFITTGTVGDTWVYGTHRMLQAELKVAHGSSGGGLFNAQGQLVGLTTFVLDSSPHSVFAVPVDWIRDLVAAPNSLLGSGGSRASLLQGFLEQMSRSPENRDRWLRFTEAWARQAPGDPEAWSAHAQALLVMGQASGPAGEGESRGGEARAALEKALAMDRNRAVDWHNLGVSLDGENRFPEATTAFREALRLRPDHGPTWRALGCTRFNAGDHQGAREALLKSTQLVPDDAVAWSLLAHAERKLKLWAEAQAHCQIALRYAPFRAAWWQLLAECAWQARDRETSDRALARLQVLDPPAARDLLKDRGRGKARS
jgi:S1-C subfamily serine protease